MGKVGLMQIGAMGGNSFPTAICRGKKFACNALRLSGDTRSAVSLDSLGRDLNVVLYLQLSSLFYSCSVHVCRYAPSDEAFGDGWTPGVTLNVESVRVQNPRRSSDQDTIGVFDLILASRFQCTTSVSAS